MQREATIKSPSNSKVTATTALRGNRRVVTITGRPGWTREEYLEAIAAAECGNDYLSWDYIENADGTEVWTFEYDRRPADVGHAAA